eukprot:CCRYP_014947-RA/>CCRYP_014947-RA protein AED:0.47 eAED:0.47 QI:19/1/1/1/0/0/2/148/42
MRSQRFSTVGHLFNHKPIVVKGCAEVKADGMAKSRMKLSSTS